MTSKIAVQNNERALAQKMKNHYLGLFYGIFYIHNNALLVAVLVCLFAISNTASFCGMGLTRYPSTLNALCALI